MMRVLLLVTAVAMPLSEEGVLERLTVAMMQHHEQVLSVRYDAPAPGIRLGSFWDGTTAIYYPRTRTIVLSDQFASCDVASILEDLTLPTSPEDDCNLAELRATLSHELGHYLTHVMLLRDVPDSWMGSYYEDQAKIGPEQLGVLVVTEGIGWHFGGMFRHGGDRFDPNGWYAPWITESDFRTRSFRSWVANKGGVALVEPIFMHRGVAAGIHWLLQHELKIVPPDLSVVPEYREQALTDPLK